MDGFRVHTPGYATKRTRNRPPADGVCKYITGRATAGRAVGPRDQVPGLVWPEASLPNGGGGRASSCAQAENAGSGDSLAGASCRRRGGVLQGDPRERAGLGVRAPANF
ncbi:hypothetical protein Rsub_08456 [Raphidocelis subcapitata]|uniref:Uncharacterized protein n=1 Tax=Raphidocelis subcapitata TaxID=307507 RepID=A0A2V0PFM1_9CHLO|nr:hypothetical protein Rsub_08456 [Raphidocelis subcapitata]|eukprot:GBF95865.1 hypothetical protein Rsub_08456 [Raphidocelis subcapitata]